VAAGPGVTLALLLIAPAWAARAKLLTPTFAWTPGMDVAVVAKSTRGDATWSVRWRVHTEAVPEGLRVWTSDVTRQGEALMYTPMDEPWPPFVVDPRGDIVSVEASEEEARVLRESWGRLVGAFAGATFTESVPIGRTDVRANGLTGWVPASTEVVTAWGGAVPCEPGARRRRCAALTLRLVPAPEATRAALEKLFVATPEIALTGSSVEEALALLTDPRTLVPRSYVAETRQHVEGTTPRGPFAGDATTTTTVTWAPSR
jgi:hypothetical protein